MDGESRLLADSTLGMDVQGVSPVVDAQSIIAEDAREGNDLARLHQDLIRDLEPVGALENIVVTGLARAELTVAAAVTAVNTGDDTSALAAGQRLAPLLAGISDPFLHAVSKLVLAWTLPITGDFDEALQEVTAALEELRGQDEPVYTAIAAFTAASLDTALGRYDDALGHLRESRDLTERAGGDWLTASSRATQGILDALRGRPDEARAPLDEALELSLAARNIPFVALCLTGYAQLALADGDPERAARLEGAAEGLRRRAGLRAWPLTRRVEAELVDQVRDRLGAGRFEQAFSAGSALTQRQVVAIVRDQRGTGTQTS